MSRQLKYQTHGDDTGLNKLNNCGFIVPKTIGK